MSRLKVLDSYALLAFFQDEPGAEKVEQLLLEADEKNKNLLLCIVNWGEVYYNIMRRQGEPIAELKATEIARMPIELIPANDTLTLLAAKFKATYSISYADCFAAALAKLKKAELVTGDKEFQKLIKEIDILWILS